MTLDECYKKQVWKQQNGRTIRICNMTTKSIETTINMLEQQGFVSSIWFNCSVDTGGWKVDPTGTPLKLLDLFQQELHRREK